MATIYVDIDDTIADTTSKILEYMKEVHNVILKKDSLLFHDYLNILLKYINKQIDPIREFEKSIYFKNIIPIKDTQQIIKNLSKNNKLIIVSGRNTALKKETEKWINKFFPSMFSKIYLVTQYPRPNEIKIIEKHELCKTLDCQFAIEDDPETALKIANSGIKVLLFNQPWNKNLKNENITRVNNWREIHNLLTKEELTIQDGYPRSI